MKEQTGSNKVKNLASLNEFGLQAQDKKGKGTV